jgi:hypothetical protein
MGLKNLHPRAASQYLASDERDNFVNFYDQTAIDACGGLRC